MRLVESMYLIFEGVTGVVFISTLCLFDSIYHLSVYYLFLTLNKYEVVSRWGTL